MKNNNYIDTLPFSSPQSDAKYVPEYETLKYLVCSRLDGINIRIRIQIKEGNSPTGLHDEVMLNIKKFNSWGSLKNNDHYSIIVKPADYPEALADAIQAVLKSH